MRFLASKCLFFALFFIFFANFALATRPKVKSFPVRQKDGKMLQVSRLNVGHDIVLYTANDGTLLTYCKDQGFCYAKISNDEIVSTNILAHESDDRSFEEDNFLKENEVNVDNVLNTIIKKNQNKSNITRAISSSTGVTPYGESAGGVVSSIGKPLIPVIMVDFPNMSFQDTTTVEKLSRQLNEKGYDDEKYCIGCVSEYFEDQSNGLFVPSFEVVALVRADSVYAYYGANSSSGRIDINCTKLVSEAIQKAYEKGVDFSKFCDESGSVPLVSIYHAGPGEHSSYEVGCDDYLWAHFSPRVNKVGEVNIRSYFVGNELLQSYKLQDGLPVVIGAKTDGMGVFVHEFGHALGLPDFYYTGSNMNIADTLQTPNYWSVMDYGQYAYDGYRQIGFSAYERAMMGWLDFQDLTDAGHYRLSTFENAQVSPSAYRILSKENPLEFFFLEYRKPDKWFPTHMGEGMLISHVDYDKNIWAQNQVNNVPNRQRYKIVSADGDLINQNENGNFSWSLVKSDLWGTSDTNSEFSDVSQPAAILNSGDFLGKPLYDIKVADDGTIHFVYLDKSLVGIDNNKIDAQIAWGCVKVYDLAGKCYDSAHHLTKGIYIIKGNGITKKVFIP